MAPETGGNRGSCAPEKSDKIGNSLSRFSIQNELKVEFLIAIRVEIGIELRAGLRIAIGIELRNELGVGLRSEPRVWSAVWVYSWAMSCHKNCVQDRAKK